MIDDYNVMVTYLNESGEWEPCHAGVTTLIGALRLERALVGGNPTLKTRLFKQDAWNEYEEKLLEDFWCPHGNHPDDYCQECLDDSDRRG